MLKKGSKGLEVKELQKRLGFKGADIDGDFGTKTESALFAMKAVKQTSLNQFSYI
jgi:peptidoglycan hydrolase-like protein with peptidoglycan-binding domain